MSDTAFIRFVGSRDGAYQAANDGYHHAQTLTGIGKRVKVTFEEAEDELTILQRGFLHKAVFPQISEHVTFPDGTRFEWRVWKEMFRARFLGDRYVLKAVPRWNAELGKFIKPKRKTPHRERISTEDLSCKKYSAYIDLVIDTAVTEFGVPFIFKAGERDGARYIAPVRKSKTASRDADEARQPEEATT